MKDRRAYIQAVLMLLLVILSVSASTLAAYFVTARIYGWTGAQPGELARQLVNSVLGFLILFGTLGLAARIAMPRRIAFFDAFNDAMRRLSRGDFNVKLSFMTRGDGHFRRLAASFNDMAARLGAMEAMRQEFISNVSHEIQSPLASISGFARALRNPGLNEEERARYLEIIETESARLSRLSDNLLRLAALESEHPPFEPRRYRLDRQLREVILAYEPQWLEKSIDVNANLERTEIVADFDLMNQVWGNLIHNSIKFTPAGGTISVSLTGEDGVVSVRIADSGTGIGPEDLPRIFERFYKADKSRQRAAGGSGLGLAIAKKIVDMHRGSIDVESEPGKGSVFTVRLPVA